MPSLKEVRQRITSVSSTQQITSAMKMVSAAKLKRAQDAIIQMRPFANKLKEILENVSSSVSSSENNYATQRKVEKVLLVVVSSNRGLCGGFNANAIKAAQRIINVRYAAQTKAGNLHLITIGKKATDFYKKANNVKLVSSHNEVFDQLNYENASIIANKIMTAFLKGEYDKVEIIYNQFKNAAVQVTTSEEFLPIAAPTENSETKKVSTKKPSSIDYIFEPNKETIIKDLIPKSLKTQFYKALLDSNASEHGARMTAMHKATDNAKEMLRELKLTYNKARQASITKEILEIVGGAEALNN